MRLLGEKTHLKRLDRPAAKTHGGPAIEKSTVAKRCHYIVTRLQCVRIGNQVELLLLCARPACLLWYELNSLCGARALVAVRGVERTRILLSRLKIISDTPYGNTAATPPPRPMPICSGKVVEWPWIIVTPWPDKRSTGNPFPGNTRSVARTVFACASSCDDSVILRYWLLYASTPVLVQKRKMVFFLGHGFRYTKRVEKRILLLKIAVLRKYRQSYRSEQKKNRCLLKTKASATGYARANIITRCFRKYDFQPNNIVFPLKTELTIKKKNSLCLFI